MRLTNKLQVPRRPSFGREKCGINRDIRYSLRGRECAECSSTVSLPAAVSSVVAVISIVAPVVVIRTVIAVQVVAILVVIIQIVIDIRFVVHVVEFVIRSDRGVGSHWAGKCIAVSSSAAAAAPALTPTGRAAAPALTPTVLTLAARGPSATSGSTAGVAPVRLALFTLAGGALATASRLLLAAFAAAACATITGAAAVVRLAVRPGVAGVIPRRTREIGGIHSVFVVIEIVAGVIDIFAIVCDVVVIVLFGRGAVGAIAACLSVGVAQRSGS
jgi:hypothetical protein